MIVDVSDLYVKRRGLILGMGLNYEMNTLCSVKIGR